MVFFIILFHKYEEVIEMARRKVEEKNYDELIEISAERIEALKEELKQEKANLKQLQKDKIRYEAFAEKQKKEEEIKKAAELLVSSGKSLEEIEAFLQTE
jgi:intergrase/recombinase